MKKLLPLILILFVSGCGLWNERTILYSEGCLFYVEGMEAQVAEDLVRQLNVTDDCKVVVTRAKESPAE